MLHSGFTLATIKLMAIMVFLLLTGPTATYALSNAAFRSGIEPPRSINTNDQEKSAP
jgi:multicomponent Na+:H+ antiporter subunit G